MFQNEEGKTKKSGIAHTAKEEGLGGNKETLKQYSLACFFCMLDNLGKIARQRTGVEMEDLDL